MASTRISETLWDAGYDTCLVDNMHLGGNRQFAGFDERPYGDLQDRHRQLGLDAIGERPVIDIARVPGLAALTLRTPTATPRTAFAS
jgi:arylsulfatase A-like enzyme